MFSRNLNINLEVSVTNNSGSEIQYLCTLVRGEVLHQYDMLSAEVGSDTPKNFMSIILGLGTYFYPVNAMSEQIT